MLNEQANIPSERTQIGLSSFIGTSRVIDCFVVIMSLCAVLCRWLPIAKPYLCYFYERVRIPMYTVEIDKILVRFLDVFLESNNGFFAKQADK